LLFSLTWCPALAFMATQVLNSEVTPIKPQVLCGTRVVLSDKKIVLRKLQQFCDDSIEKLAVISDFDYTMSRFWKSDHGDRSASCHKVLEDCDFINPDYKILAGNLQKYYYPLEVDPSLDDETRTTYMIEWFTKAHDLLIQNRVSREIIHNAAEEAIANERIRLRPRLFEFIDFLKKMQIPLQIFSAGLGDVMDEVLRHFIHLEEYPDLHIIANRGLFDEETGLLKRFVDPLIHVFNKKSATFLETAPFFQRKDMEKRTNMILIGDSLGDVTMTDGIPYLLKDNVLRLGK
jgi:HAD superfamily hydrolase (TIGR01544 family)